MELKTERIASWICWTLFWFCVGFYGVRLIGAEDYFEPHRYADAVLAPRFHAAVNDFVYQHPQDSKQGSWDHVHKLNDLDLKRYRVMRAAFREMDEQMRKAGY